ncbi:MAG: phosphonate C-P lyase system protein PhnG [Pseudomonadota bacterium]
MSPHTSQHSDGSCGATGATLSAPQAARQHRLSIFATAPHEELLKLWETWSAGRTLPDHQVLRSPEIGTVMVRGRTGGVGAPFNLGEITVTRCSVQLAQGPAGHGYVQGRSKDAAIAIALMDALAEAGEADAIDAAITAPLKTNTENQRQVRGEKAAKTKVEFFTMVRGDN